MKQNAKDQCKHIDDIEKRVDKRLEKGSMAGLIFVMQTAIVNHIRYQWKVELKKSIHRNAGRGWAYTDTHHTITDHPSPEVLNRQARRELDKINAYLLKNNKPL